MSGRQALTGSRKPPIGFHLFLKFIGTVIHGITVGLNFRPGRTSFCSAIFLALPPECNWKVFVAVSLATGFNRFTSMTKTFWTASLYLLFLVAASAAQIGHPAPPLAVQKWIKGSPVKISPGTNIFVVEFWATWCGPCKKSIPHITQMQKKYSDRGVIFVGVSDEPIATVESFVAGQGDNMSYRVATDSSKRNVTSWLKAFEAPGIPHAYVISTNGLVLWHGFPNEDLDRTLEKILTGKFDMALAQNKEIGERLLENYEVTVRQPMSVLRAAPTGEKILANYSKDWRVAYRLAHLILVDNSIRSRDFDLALKATTMAIELTQNHSSDALALHARALFAKGKRIEAIETQKQSIAICRDVEAKREREKLLAYFQKNAQEPPAKTK